MAAAELRDSHQLKCTLRACRPLGPRHAHRPQDEGEILRHRHVRPEGQVLEDEPEAAHVWRHQVAARLCDQGAVDGDGARIRRLEARDEAQQRRLAAPARDRG